MAGLFDEQSSLYAFARPAYPPSLFAFLSSLTDKHELAWDVGTGNGQAAVAVAEFYDTVIGTDVSGQQLEYAQKRPNVVYYRTSVRLTEEELNGIVGPEGSVDLVTVAQALHWFDLESFYPQVKRLLRKPGGVFAAWCYIKPTINPAVDSVLGEYYTSLLPYWEPARQLVDDEYRPVFFPFTSVLKDGRGTGPIRFDATKQMKLDDFLLYLKTWSVLQCARAQGVEVLTDDVQKAFRDAWGCPEEVRTVTFPVFLRVGTVPL